MECLAHIEQYLLKSPENYEVQQYQPQKFLKVTKFFNQGLKYLPNCYLLFQSLDNESISIKTLTYHGKPLSTVFFKLTNEAPVPEEVHQALEVLNDKTHLCQGVDKSRASTPDCLLEFFNEDIIARSAKCKFLISDDSNICKECERLIGVKKEVDPESHPFLRPKEELPVQHGSFKDELDAAFEELDYETEMPKVDVIMKDEDGEYGDYDDDWQVYDEEDYVYEPLPKKKRGPKPKKEKTSSDSSPKKRGRPRLTLEEKEERALQRSLSGNVKAVADGSIRCKICLKATATKNALGHHMKVHRMYFDTTGTMECPLCKETIEKLELTAHFEESHSTKDNPQTCCLACLEVMPHKDGDLLREHISKSHQQQNVCEICGQVFKEIKRLECHVKTKHFPESPKEFFCDRCGKGFAHELPLRKHVKFACAMEEWKCEFCSKIFTYRQRLRYHLMVHCDEKPYACKLCGYR